MPNPRVKFKGLLNLGAAIDSRIRNATNRKRSTQTRSSPSVPLSQGGFPGGSGQGETPVVPEAWVESLQAAGAATPLTGALVIAGEGETTVTQSSLAPHLTVCSPVLSAADGVTRDGDEFSADASVVRTSGDQSIGGIKQFTSFPCTPAGVPAAEYEAANKKYVDAEVGAAQLWRRETQVLSPLHDGDALHLDNELAATRTSATAAALLLSVANESQPRLTIQQDGRMSWGGGGMQDTQLQRQASGVLAVGSGNAFRSGEYCELALNAEDAQLPGAGYGRVYCKADARAYCAGPDGAVHDLSVAHKQTFPALGGAQGQVPLLLQAHAAYPSGAALPADFVISNGFQCNWAAGTGPAQFTESSLTLSWTSTAQDLTVTAGAQVALGEACRRFGRCADVRARICVNDPARFSSLYLSLNDTDGHSAETANLASMMIGNYWHDALLCNLDLINWNSNLRLVVSAQGTLDAQHAGLTQLRIEYLSLEQWAN